MAMFTLIKSVELVDQTELGLHSDGHDLRWLSLTTTVQDECGPGIMTVVPGGLDKEAPDMGIAGFGN